MKSRILTLLALLALVAGVGPTTAGSTAAAPTARQIGAAIGRATHSHGLWATVNICNTRRHRDTVGIRAQMPALRFPATLQMHVSLNYYSLATAAFEPLPHTSTVLSAGTLSSGYHQEGVTFLVRPPAILQGLVKFVWRSGRRVFGTTLRVTGGGHSGAQQGDPAGYSAATCRIGE